MPIVKYLGPKKCLIVGALCYTLYVSTFILAAYKAENPASSSVLLSKSFIVPAILIAAAINGFGASILWVAEGHYLSNCAND